MSKCSSCKNESVYFRTNEGRHYCKVCFSKNIEKKVRLTISKNNLIKNGDKIVVAFSGGKDSGNLLYLLHKIFKDNPNVKIVGMTIDEGIKGYRNITIDKCADFCKKLDVEHHIFTYKEYFHTTIDNLAKDNDDSMCGFCGIFRRYLLNEGARRLDATKLATGHNLDDETQSILMNVLKGDLMRFARIGPIPKIKRHIKFVQRIKPLISIPERESALYAMLNSIPAYFTECPYAQRNALRMETRDFLNKMEERSPGIKYSIISSAQRVAPFIEASFKKSNIKECETCGEPTSGNICIVCQTMKKVNIKLSKSS
ncbi:MAG: TIGR00269 family protein [Candidatus Aenigmarchaeota archaeon]|nr:TIGR00269 family protein [Candidatus Aenigmarchaeota archaeon]